MASQIKLTDGLPPPRPHRDYTADEICAAESLLMLAQSIFSSSLSSSNPSAATSSVPAAATPPAAALCVQKIEDWSPPPSSNFPHTCEVCGDAFKSPQALGGHKTRHRPKSTAAAVALTVSGNDRVHECSICQEQFRTGQALGGHKRKHFEGIIGGGASKSVKTSSDGGPGRVVVIEDDGQSHASTRLLDLDLNLPYTWL